MQSGWRYTLHSPAIKIAIVRCAIFGFAGGSLAGLLPLVAKNMLGGGAQTYGLLLGAFGVGAVIGAFAVPQMQRSFKSEVAIRTCTLMIGVGIVAVSFSHSLPLSVIALIVAGSGWTTSLGLFNIGVQFSAPRWVAGRALAFFQTAVAGGAAVGAWGWGHLADVTNVEFALLVSGIAMLASTLLGIWLRMPDVSRAGFDPAEALADPEVRLQLTARSGPIVIEIEYRVAPDRAREFYGLMLQVQLSRQRNGAYGWSIARDIANDELWTERYHCPTWMDYLRMRSRSTIGDRELYARVDGFHLGSEPVRVHRMLERPFGSVRWKEDTPDRASDLIAEVRPAGN
jgi:MFS family permease